MDTAMPADFAVPPVQSPNVQKTIVPVQVSGATQSDAVLPSYALPTVVQHLQQQVAAQGGSSTQKERAASGALQETPTDTTVGVQVVEQERTPEISPELEKFIQKVEDHQEQLPQEIVIADAQHAGQIAQHAAAQPVIVLPITPELEQVGARKSPRFSLRWLVEWSRKIMKMFVGRVVYYFEK